MSKKILALALAFAFAFSFTAKAVTIEELQAQIQALLAQLAALQGQQSTGMYCFNTDLKYGMTSNDVKNLQIVLGVTPQTGYFGPKTLAAVKSYQASKGIPTTGYVGPMTRTALNAQYCVPPTTTTTAPEATTTTTTVVPSYGSLTVTNYPLSNPLTTLYGGGTYEVLAGQFKAIGSDITLKKVTVQITHSSGAFPWTYFSSVSVWDGSTKVGETAVTQANLIENSFSRDYYVVLSGLNWVIPNGQSKVLTVKVTIAPTIVTSTSFTFALPTTQVVYTDTAGVTYTSVTGSVNNNIVTISNAQTSSAVITPASDNPLAGNVIGSTSGTTKADLLKFNVKVDNVNATFNSGSLTVTSNATTSNAYLVALELWDGSTLLASAAPSWTTTTGTVSWSNFTLPVSAGTTKTLTVKGVFAQLSTSYTGGANFYVSVGPTLTGIDANSNVVTTSGSATGNSQYLYLVAPTFALANINIQENQGPTSAPASVARTRITFQVTAHGGDIYISASSSETYAAASPTPSSDVRGFTCTSNATLSSGYWRVNQGVTATCELNNTLTVSTSTLNNYYQVQISRITWNTSATSTNAVTQTWGWDNFKTGLLYVAY